MKKIVVSIFLMLYCSTMVMACEKNSYNVYGLSLEANFFVPPTRKYIIQYGTNFEIDSCKLTSLFKEVMEKEREGQGTDLTDLRILIVREKDSMELFITSTKKIVYENKKYEIDSIIMNDALLEINNYMKKNKLE